MEITIDKLEPGDEIITCSGSKLFYLCVKEYPRLSKTRIQWHTKNPLYVAIKCSLHIDKKIKSWQNWQGGVSQYETKDYLLSSPEMHNTTKRFDLNDKKIWLVKNIIDNN